MDWEVSMKQEFTFTDPFTKEKYKCSLFKRKRQYAKFTIRDWLIQLTQKAAPNHTDYLIVRRLPCKLDEFKTYIKSDKS